MIKVFEKKLKDINLNDSFFDSLRSDYNNFNEWFINKENNNYSAYVAYGCEKLIAFLLLKVEDSSEDYSNFSENMSLGKKLKICTFKVLKTDNGIGSEFVNIINNKMKELDIWESYITVLDKYSNLISFLLKRGFSFFCLKENGKICERVYLLKRNVRILIPIKPCFSNKILSGEKKYEYRRIKPKKNINKLVIYSTSPVSSIVGEVQVLEIIEDDVYKVWNMTHDYSGISFEDYCTYYKGKDRAVAYKLGKVLIYDMPLKLNDLGINYVPQSYIYLD